MDGNIGYQSPGAIPVRGKGDGRWPRRAGTRPTTGRASSRSTSCPACFNPAAGLRRHRQPGRDRRRSTRTCSPTTGATATAASASTSMIADARRRPKITVDDVQRMQFDNRNGFAPTLVPVLLAAPRDRPSQWRRAPTTCCAAGTSSRAQDSAAAAAYYNAIWRHLLAAHLRRAARGARADGGDRWFEVVRSLLDAARRRRGGTPRARREVEKRDDMLAPRHDRGGEGAGRPARRRPGAVALGRPCTPSRRPTQTFGESGIGPIEWLFNRGPAGVAGGGDDRQRHRLERGRGLRGRLRCRRCA